jgi:S1-C subfamily serine protease
MSTQRTPADHDSLFSRPLIFVAAMFALLAAPSALLAADDPAPGESKQRGYLGITVEDADPSGARITSASDGSPAAAAGLKVGDLIESVDDTPIKGFEDLAARIGRVRSGTIVELTVVRDGEALTIDVVLGERKPPSVPGRRFAVPSTLRDLRDIEAWTRTRPQFGSDGALLGVQTQPVTESLAKTLELTTTDGALVNSVVRGSPADRAGLRTSDLIVEINGEPVKSPLELHEQIQKAGPGAKITVGVIRDGKKETLDATLAQQPLRLGPGEAPIWSRMPPTILGPDQAAGWIEALEERVRVLEQRIEALERRLRERGEKPAPADDKR